MDEIRKRLSAARHDLEDARSVEALDGVIEALDLLVDVLDVRRIERLDLKSGDLVVVTIPDLANGAGLALARRQLQDTFPDGVKIVVKAAGVEMGVVRAEEAGSGD